jgi:cation transport ATPase
MKKQFRLEGLDCANCAAKMEKDIGALSGVTTASVNHMTTKLVFETAENADINFIIAEAEKIVHKYEPEVVMKRA